MTTDSEVILKQLAALTAEMADVRTALEVQFKRMPSMQAEIDLLPAARRWRRAGVRPSPQTPAHSDRGNGHG